jgi:glycosyltransferase involved in cell wall biosynthesis
MGEQPGQPAKCVTSRAHAWTLRMAADHVIAISQAVKDHAVADYGLPADLISVVHNGSDPAAGDVTVESETGAERLVVSIGSLHPSKGFLDLIDVADRVLRVQDGVKFVVLGEGPQRPALERRIAELSLQGRVLLPGHRDDAAAVLRRANVLVTTSEWEGFGRTITEAMACGVPVVARRVGAMPEIVDQGRTGFLCRTTDDFAAAVTQLLASPSQAARMGAEGRARFERCFTSAVNVAATARVIEQELSGRTKESAGEDAAIA